MMRAISRPGDQGDHHRLRGPAAHPTIMELCERYFGLTPMIVGPGIKTGISIKMDNPKEVGADRIVNSVAVFAKHHKPAIVVDFGTATTFDYVSSTGDYMGGVIAPGVNISAEALFRQASKLPRIEIVKPATVIGKNTVAAMQSGLFYGYVAMVEGIIDRIRKEVRLDPLVIATGGLARRSPPRRQKSMESMRIDSRGAAYYIREEPFLTRGSPGPRDIRPVRRTVRVDIQQIRNVGIIGARGSGEDDAGGGASVRREGHGPDGKGGRRKFQLRLRPGGDPAEDHDQHLLPSLHLDKVEVTLADTPGYINFEADTRSCLKVLDGAILVVNAVSGVEVQTEKMWNLARGRTCR